MIPEYLSQEHPFGFNEQQDEDMLCFSPSDSDLHNLSTAGIIFKAEEM